MSIKFPPKKVQDHSVSGEEFELKFNAEGDILITHPQPSKSESGKYYDSEDYISHTDSRRGIFERIYQYVKKISLKRKLNLIRPFKDEDANLLDVGCGTGDFLRAAHNDGWTVHGVEPNQGARSLAQHKTNATIYQSLEEVTESRFQVISLWHVLEHLHDLDEQIKTFSNLLAENGRLIIAVPNFKSFDASYYKNYWAAFDVPRHLWHFSKDGIRRIFSKHGMEIEQTLPMKFDAYYVSLLSEKYKSGWMNFFGAFFVASRSNLKAAKTGEYSSLIYVIKKAK